MRTRVALALGSAVCLVAVSAFTQQFPLRQQTPPLVRGPVQIEKVKDGLYVIRGPFVPCGARGCRPGRVDDGIIREPGDVALRVTPAGLILVDDKYEENVADVLARVRAVSPLPIRYLLNTHHHGDHTGGNVTLRDMGVDVIAHKNIRENFIRTKQPGAPNITFADQSAVYLGGVEVQLFYFGRGHTNGDTVIYFPDLKTVHTGDLIIDGMPVIDYAGGGSAVAFIKTLDNLLQLDFDTMIPGHGRVMRKDDVRAYKVRFEEMNRRMATIVRHHTPVEQAQAALKLEELGWANSVSTSTWAAEFRSYYDEIAAATR